MKREPSANDAWFFRAREELFNTSAFLSTLPSLGLPSYATLPLSRLLRPHVRYFVFVPVLVHLFRRERREIGVAHDSVALDSSANWPLIKRTSYFNENVVGETMRGGYESDMLSGCRSCVSPIESWHLTRVSPLAISSMNVSEARLRRAGP